MSKQPLPVSTASAIGHYPTIIQIVGRPGTGSLPRTFAPPDHHLLVLGKRVEIDGRKNMPGFAAFTFGLLLHAHSLSMLFYVNGSSDT